MVPVVVCQFCRLPQYDCLSSVYRDNSFEMDANIVLDDLLGDRIHSRSSDCNECATFSEVTTMLSIVHGNLLDGQLTACVLLTATETIPKGHAWQNQSVQYR